MIFISVYYIAKRRSILKNSPLRKPKTIDRDTYLEEYTEHIIRSDSLGNPIIEGLKNHKI